MNRFLAVALLLSAFCTMTERAVAEETATAAASPLEIEFGGRLQMLFLHGSAVFEEKPARSDTVRVHGDLGIWQAASLQTHLRVLYSGFGGELEATRVHGRGSTDIHRAIRWNESNFANGESVTSYLDLNHARLSFLWRSPDTRFFRFDLGAGLRYDRWTLRLEGDRDKLGLATPEAGGRVVFHPSQRIGDYYDGPPVELNLRARVFGLAGRRASAFGWTFDGGVCLHIGHYMQIEIGYSVQSARFHRRSSGEDNRLDLFAQGPFVEMQIQF